MSRYRFALRPKWIVSHIFIAFLVILMINLGFWQLRRLHEKRTHNKEVLARSAQPLVPVRTLAKAGDPQSVVGPDEYRRVSAIGRYAADEEVLVRSRSWDSAPGSWILTPLVLPDGSAVVVNRGWIPNGGVYSAVPKRYRAPEGVVRVTGLFRQTEKRGAFGPHDPPTGRLTNLARADVVRLGKQVPQHLVPGWIQLQTQRPSEGSGAARPLPFPTLDEGPHLSYAFQWFFFTSVALVGYPLILRRRAREVAIEELAEPDPDPDPEPDPSDPS